MILSDEDIRDIEAAKKLLGATGLAKAICVHRQTLYDAIRKRSGLSPAIMASLRGAIAPYLAAPDTPIATPGNRNDNPARALLMERVGRLSDDQVDLVLAYVLALPKE